MTKKVARAAALDVASILVFVAIGRRSHDEPGNVIVGIGKVAAPFLIALTLAWVVTKAWKHPEAVKTGVAIWALTVIDGMLLRHVVFDRGTATSFIVVTAIVTAVFMIGWRLIATQRRQPKGDS